MAERHLTVSEQQVMQRALRRSSVKLNDPMVKAARKVVYYYQLGSREGVLAEAIAELALLVGRPDRLEDV